MVFLIVRSQRVSRSSVPVAAGMAILFAPSLVLNSAFWGQADSLYTAALLGWIYLMMTRRPVWATACFGIALAFKLQAIFLAPVLVALVLKGYVPWKSLLLVPLIMLLALVPSWLAGRPIAELLNIYANQASQYDSITMNAPSAYAWLPGSKQVFNIFYGPGLIAGAAAALMWCFILYRSPRPLSAKLMLEVTLVAAIVVPFFLPKMHERYFYPADVLSIAFAFLYAELFYVPFLVVGSSFLSYQPFLFERALVPLPLLTFVLLGLATMLSYHAMRQLYARPSNGPAAINANDPPPSSARVDLEG